MADPLRRTLLAKLRGKKPKRGATLGGGGGGLGSAAADGSREGKEKVLLRGSSLEAPVVWLPAERMSEYDNCVAGPTGLPGRVEGLREREGGPPEQSSGGRGRVDEQLPGLGGDVSGEADGSHRGLGPGLQRTRFVSVPRQRSAGDSIGFGDNSNRVTRRVEPRTGAGEAAPESRVPCGAGAGSEPGDGAGSRHMAPAAAALVGHNANRSSHNNPAPELMDPSCVTRNTEENILIRNIESYDPEFAGDVRGPVGGPLSPTFFPTELEICDLHRASPPASLRFPGDSEDEDYYDNEILPFYETIRVNSDRCEAADLHPPSGRDRGGSAQETDRLRNQLQEAYYLLINAMNDINLDVQQVGGGSTEQQATSSCSSHSRDSLCSRLSAKNMDSDSWSSGGDHSPQQGSDTDSVLLCISGNPESGLRSRLSSKSMENLTHSEMRPTLQRSASVGAIRYPGGVSVCVRAPGTQNPGACSDKEASEAREGVGDVGELSDGNAISSDDLLQEAGGSGSVNSLTGSSDSNGEASTHQSPSKQEPSGAGAQGPNAPNNKGHGVTVNKMQEWMHKGRLLSSEMKQRIEGSSLPRGGGQSQERPCAQAHPGGSKPGVQTAGREVKSGKVKSPTVKSPQQQHHHHHHHQQQQPAFIENVLTPFANGREPARAAEPSSRRPPLTTITVSKKRNWLQQSSHGKSHCPKDELERTLGAEEEGSHQPPPPPSPSPDHLRPPGGAPPRPVRLQLPQVIVGQAKVSPPPRSVDPAEENDADDEGEIWYNPIPEDDDADSSHRPPVRLLVPPRTELERRPSRAGDVSHGGSGVPEVLGEGGVGGGGGSGDGSQGNAVHSTEAPHLHRQMLACKPQEEGGPSSSRVTDGAELPNAVGFSPPSSPNPTKKSSSINWSFPDKIKSPRTVRKISMRMKKLPELSRKLSVKGTSSGSSSSNNGSSQPEPRAHSPRNNSETVSQTSGPPRLTAPGGGQASRNVISRYHLDSSVSMQHSFSKKKSNGSSKSASKGGYLSDGDSPELVAKSGKHGASEGKGGKGKEVEAGGSSKLNGTELDIDAFRHYSFTEQPKCSQYISGLMSLHFYGAEDLKPPRVDSRDVYCAIQVDSVNKARTALLTCRTSFLDMDHTFNIELENAQHLKLVVFSWEPTPRRNRVCCHGTVVLPALFRVTRSHQLAVKLEPRGLIYVKLNLMEQWQNSLDGRFGGDREPKVFGVEVWRVVERENTGLMVPLLINKCINEIEKRGCQVVGLYRLCGSAAVKKELREAFERDSYALELCENTYPDINVITGVLKDYLRELPYPLITKLLYEAVLEAMATRPLRIGPGGCENDQADSEHTVSLLENLPEVERVTLRKLLNHLKLVASHQDVNKMTCQNLAVCFGPVLLSQRQEASCHTNRVFIDSEELASALHFKKHIEVLHYLLQLWPVVDPHGESSFQPLASSDLLSAPPLRRRKERPQVLNLSEAEMAGVLRPRPGRLDSPSNRYAGDWSRCGENYFPSEVLLPPSKEEADYDDVPSEDTEAAEEEEEEEQEKPEDEEEDKEQKVASDPAEQEPPPLEDVVKEVEEVNEEEEDEEEEEKHVESDSSGNGQPLEDEEEEEEEEVRLCDHILPPRLPREHTYQAYMKIQDISPVLSNRVNLKDLQESIDTLIGNLERELNKNKLNVGY
ncbi:rho GTPase-activating protein SYDE2 [Limanda limanda]|uniref:rho GTPase-activating protein SYDE2 n=1 Tax=Limanda limanda TaxID=27771 RepID=UPI0029C8DCD1|nr:rho GTPase-activating protein SYDE2 [Limanda limanda]